MTERAQKCWRHLTQGAVAIAVLSISGGAAGSWESMPEATNPASTQIVTIENMRFNPEELIVKRGSRVVWVNKDMFAHTATAADKTFDSGNIAAEASWSFVASQPGDYAYLCAFHPTMQGKLIVQ